MVSYGISQQTYSVDNLIIDAVKVVTEETIVLSGAGVLTRSVLLGKITKEVSTIIVADSENTGDGTFAAVLGAYAEKGDYILTMTGATAYALVSPSGQILTSTNSQLTTTLSAGSTPLVSSDFFTITVATPATEKYKECVATNVDGSEVPDRILGEDIDATSADVTTWAYISAEVDEDEVTIDSSLTIAGIKDVLRTKDLFLKPTLEGN